MPPSHTCHRLAEACSGSVRKCAKQDKCIFSKHKNEIVPKIQHSPQRNWQELSIRLESTSVQIKVGSNFLHRCRFCGRRRNPPLFCQQIKVQQSDFRTDMAVLSSEWAGCSFGNNAPKAEQLLILRWAVYRSHSKRLVVASRSGYEVHWKVTSKPHLQKQNNFQPFIQRKWSLSAYPKGDNFYPEIRTCPQKNMVLGVTKRKKWIS